MHILNITLYVALFCVSVSLRCAESVPKQVAKLSFSESSLQKTNPIAISKMKGAERQTTQSCIDFGGHRFQSPENKKKFQQKRDKFGGKLNRSKDPSSPAHDDVDLPFEMEM